MAENKRLITAADLDFLGDTGSGNLTNTSKLGTGVVPQDTINPNTQTLDTQTPNNTQDTSKRLITAADLDFLGDTAQGITPKPVQKKEDTSFFGERANSISSSFIRGAADFGGDVLQGVSEASDIAIGDRKSKIEEGLLFRAGTSLQEAAEEAFPVSPEAEQTFANQIANAFGQVAGLAGGTAAAATAGLGTAAASGLGLLASVAALGNQQADDYLASLNPGDEIESQKRTAAFVTGAPVGVLEAVPIFKALGRVDKVTGGLASKILKKRGPKVLQGKAGRIVGNTLQGAVEEGGAEMLQQIASNLIASDIVKYDKDRKTLEGVQESGEVGAAAGGALNLLLSAIGGKGRVSLSNKRAGKFEKAGESSVQEEDAISPETRKIREFTQDLDAVKTPLSRTDFSDKTVKGIFQKGVEAADNKFAVEEEGQDSGIHSETIRSTINDLEALRESNQDSDTTLQEIDESLTFLKSTLDTNASINNDTIDAKKVLGEEGSVQELTPEKQEQIEALETEIESVLGQREGVAESSEAALQQETLQQETLQQEEAIQQENLPPEDNIVEDPEQRPVENKNIDNTVPDALKENRSALIEDAVPTSVETDNRQASGLREAISKLSPERQAEVISLLRTENAGLRAEKDRLSKRLYTSEVAGIPNKSAYTDAPKKEFQAFIDIDSLKFLNDALGHEGGNTLIKRVSQAINTFLPTDSFHISGDEIVAQADSPEILQEALTQAQQALQTEVIEGNDIETGNPAKQTGLSFTFGIATDIEAADRAMIAEKERKTKLGLRAERGTAPKGFEVLESRVDLVSPEALDTLANDVDLDTIDTELADRQAELEVMRQDPLADPETVESLRARVIELRKTKKTLKEAGAEKLEAPAEQTIGDFHEESFGVEDLEVELLSSVQPEGGTSDGVTVAQNTDLDSPRATPDQTRAGVKSAIEFVTGKLEKRTLKKLQIKYVDKFSDLPVALSGKVKADGAKAVYTRNTKSGNTLIYFVGERFRNPADAVKTALHEIVGHHGLREVINSKAEPAAYDNLLRKLLNTSPLIRTDILSKVVRWRDYLVSWQKENTIQDWPADRKETFITPNGDKIEVPDQVALRLADEYLADLAKNRLISKNFIENVMEVKQDGSRNSNKIDKIFTRFLNTIRHALRKVFGGFSEGITADDLNAAIAKSADSLFKKTPLNFYKFNDIKSSRNDIENIENLLTEESYTSLPAWKDQARKLAKQQGMKEVDILRVARLSSENFGSLDGQVVGSKKYLKGINTALGTKLYNKMADKMRNTRGMKVFTRLGSLQAQQTYRNIEKVVFSEHANIDSYLRSGKAAMANLNTVQTKQATQFLRTANADPAKLALPQETVDYLVNAKDMIEILGEKLKDAGYISEATFEENRGAYLTTLYTKYFRESFLTGKKTSFLNWAKGKKDIPKEIQLELGRIEDPEILIAETIGTLSNDAYVLDFYKAIRDVSGDQGLLWVLDNDRKVSYESVATTGSKTVTKSLSELESDINRLDWKIKQNIEEDAGSEQTLEIRNAVLNLNRMQNALKNGQKEMELEMVEEVKKSAVASGEIDADDFNSATYISDKYQRIPSSKRYGNLSGKYVRKEIHSDIIGTMKALEAQITSPFVKTLVTGTKQFHGNWKFLKAVASPAQLIRNSANNLMLLDRSSRRNPISLFTWASDSMWSRLNGQPNEWGRIHDRVAGGDNTFVEQELRNIRKRRGEVLIEQNKLKSASGIDKIFAGTKIMYSMFQDSTSNFMAITEKGTKDAAIRDYLETWKSLNQKDWKDLNTSEQDTLFLQAVQHANDSIFDYSDVPELVRTVRSVPLGAPFLTYNYKVVPADLKAALNNPHKAALQMAIPGIITSWAVSAISEFAEKEQEDLINKLPEYYRQSGTSLLLPFRDSDGTPQFMDLSYLFPHATTFKMVSNAVNNFHDASVAGVAKGTLDTLYGTLVDDLGFLGGVVPQTVTALRENKDSFGRDVINKNAPPSVQLAQFMQYGMNSVLPTMMTTTGPLAKAADSLFGERTLDRQKNPRYTFGQSMGSFVGFEARKFDTKKLERDAGAEFSFKNFELERERRRILKDPNVTDPKERAKLLGHINERKKVIVAERDLRLK